MSKQLTIQLLGWNHAAQLPRTLRALARVPRHLAHVRYLDNHSADQSVTVVTAELPQAEIIRLTANYGFAGGHNRGLAQTTTPYVLILNPDVAIVWSGIERLVAYLEQHPNVGAIQGKLLRDGTMPLVIDSAGISLSPALNGYDRGAGEVDRGQYDRAAALTAVTGACGLYRVTALHQVRHGLDEYFDTDFFAYKEDVDLGWRLNRAGWTVHYEPVVVGHHIRALRRGGRASWDIHPQRVYQRLRDQRTQSSFRNWLWLLAKNAAGPQLVMHSPFILGRLMVFFLLTIAYPPFLQAWFAAAQGYSKMTRKRPLSAEPVPAAD